MRTFTDKEPLNDAELDCLGNFLKSCKDGKAMNVEQLDGFFAALIAGPETVMPSEYYREVLRRRDVGRVRVSFGDETALIYPWRIVKEKFNENSPPASNRWPLHQSVNTATTCRRAKRKARPAREQEAYRTCRFDGCAS